MHGTVVFARSVRPTRILIITLWALHVRPGAESSVQLLTAREDSLTRTGTQLLPTAQTLVSAALIPVGHAAGEEVSSRVSKQSIKGIRSPFSMLGSGPIANITSCSHTAMKDGATFRPHLE